jgi:hypothetical protein
MSLGCCWLESLGSWFDGDPEFLGGGSGED